jgi:hypothetical protein
MIIQGPGMAPNNSHQGGCPYTTLNNQEPDRNKKSETHRHSENCRRFRLPNCNIDSGHDKYRMSARPYLRRRQASYCRPGLWYVGGMPCSATPWNACHGWRRWRVKRPIRPRASPRSGPNLKTEAVRYSSPGNVKMACFRGPDSAIEFVHVFQHSCPKGMPTGG